MPATVIDITTRQNHPATTDHAEQCACATSLGEVQAAWELVYRRYVAMGLIDANPFSMYAAPTAVGAHACVIWGPEGAEGPDIGYTMTLVRDNRLGLALDSVYPSQLDALRRDGRRLLEVGMLADRRRSTARGVQALVGMMRWAVHYALYSDASDVIIGVHPHHAAFYARYFGFAQIGPVTSYPLVHDHLVVPMHVPLLQKLALANPPRGIALARSHPIELSVFDDRFSFEPAALRGSRIAGFLETRYGLDPCAPAASRPLPAVVLRRKADAPDHARTVRFPA